LCAIAAISKVTFSPADRRTHAETTSSADETRSDFHATLSFEASTVPPQGTGVTSFVILSVRPRATYSRMLIIVVGIILYT